MVEINKSELFEALELVKPGLETGKERLAQTSKFAFLPGKVVTYDDEISISHPVTGLDFEGAVDGKALYEFLNKLTKDTINVDTKGNQVVISAGRAKAGILVEQQIKLPLEEVGTIDGDWIPLPEEFVSALKFCIPCAATNMSRPLLTCINIHGDAIEATDSYQIVKYRMESSVSDRSILIPATAVQKLVQYPVSEISAGNSSNSGWVHFRTDNGTIFSSRVVDGTFPDIDKHLQMSNGRQFVFPDTTTEVLSRAQVFAQDSNTVGNIPVAKVSVSPTHIHISSKNSVGWFEESISQRGKAKENSESFAFIVGIEFLVSLLETLRECEVSEHKIKFVGQTWEHVLALTPTE